MTAREFYVVGRRGYRGSARAEPSGPDTIDWEMSYETVDGDTIVEEFTAADRWVVVGPEQLADELAPRGLTITEADADQFLHTITRCSAPAGSPRRGHGAEGGVSPTAAPESSW